MHSLTYIYLSIYYLFLFIQFQPGIAVKIGLSDLKDIQTTKQIKDMFQTFCYIGKPFMIVRNVYYTYLKLFKNRYVSYNFIIIINHLIRKYHIIFNLLNVAIMLIIYRDNIE